MRKLLIPFAVAFALAGCSADNTVSGKSALTGGDAFLELVQDARIAIEGGNLPEAGQFYDKARELEPGKSRSLGRYCKIALSWRRAFDRH